MTGAANPLLIDAERAGYVHPAVQVGPRIFADSAVYGGGMNNQFAKAHFRAKELATEMDRDIAAAVERLHLKEWK